MDRRDFLRLLAATVGSGSAGKFVLSTAAADSAAGPYSASAGLGLDVRAFGAAGDGKAIDTLAVNKLSRTLRRRAAESCAFRLGRMCVSPSTWRASSHSTSSRAR
jgi:hypothetical protein